MSRLANKKPPEGKHGIATAPAAATTVPAMARAVWRSPWLDLGALVVAASVTLAFLLPGKPDTGRMIRVPGGAFGMGSAEDRSLDCDAASCCGKKDGMPLHSVELSDVWMDETPVTNAEFDRFVRSTGHVTRAERAEDKLGRGGFVFRPGPRLTSPKNHRPWWEVGPGGDWPHPEGPESTIRAHDRHPGVPDRPAGARHSLA